MLRRSRMQSVAGAALASAWLCAGAVTSNAADAPAVASNAADAPAVPAAATTAAEADTGMVLKAGEEGTALRDLTVEGENRVQIQFERPPLHLDLDPAQAPGLDWGSPKDVLERTAPDVNAPLLASTSELACPYLGRPWLASLGSGTVARFQPRVEGVERWKLMVADSRGATVAEFAGKGKPPSEIAWNGARVDGSPALPGLTYSYALEAYDRAGNKRTFVGEGFGLPPYRFSSPKGESILLPGDALVASPSSSALAAASSSSASAGSAHPLVLEAASWINQAPSTSAVVVVTALARGSEQARLLGDAVADGLRPRLLGAPSRIQVVTEVQPDAPANGVVRIALQAPGRPGA